MVSDFLAQCIGKKEAERLYGKGRYEDEEYDEECYEGAAPRVADPEYEHEEYEPVVRRRASTRAADRECECECECECDDDGCDCDCGCDIDGFDDGIDDLLGGGSADKWLDSILD